MHCDSVESVSLRNSGGHFGEGAREEFHIDFFDSWAYGAVCGATLN